ncbi:MAG: YwaF family protein [Clostridia bacterium]|nr:YwaF family protein [Clostridia bacterium]
MNKEIFYIIPNTIGVLFNIIFLYFAIKKYKDKSYKERVKPLKFLAIMLITLELIKIYTYIGQNQNFTPARYPIIYCSFIMYAYPIIYTAKENSVASRIAKGISAITGLVIGGLFLVFCPDENYTIELFYHNLHSRFYHFGMLAGAIYIIAVNLYDFRFRDFYICGLTVSAYMLFCTIFSIFLGGDISYFGPNRSPLRFIYNIFGYCVGNTFVIMLVMLLSLLGFFVANFIKKKYFKSN